MSVTNSNMRGWKTYRVLKWGKFNVPYMSLNRQSEVIFNWTPSYSDLRKIDVTSRSKSWKCDIILSCNAQFSHHLKILQTKPTTKMQEAALVERLRYTQKMYIKCSVQRCEVGVVQAFQPHFITEKFTWSLGRVWWRILVTNLATNFQDLVDNAESLGTLATVLGAISCPV